ncbi:MAG: hypothetical protein ACMUIL_02940 [bacterium]
MKRSVSIVVIVIFLVSVCLFSLPRSSRAAERPLKSVFVDTMFGLATGTVIAAAVTVADGDAHGDDWGRNLGIGATIGAFVGVAFGIATESQSLLYLDGARLSCHLPLPRMRSFSSQENAVTFELFRWRY